MCQNEGLTYLAFTLPHSHGSVCSLLAADGCSRDCTWAFPVMEHVCLTCMIFCCTITQLLWKKGLSLNGICWDLCPTIH